MNYSVYLVSSFIVLILSACQRPSTPRETIPEQHVRAKKRVDEVYKRLLEGQSFEFQAQAYSSHGDMDNRSGLGWYKKGNVVDSFYEVASRLKPNSFSAPFSNAYGYYIVKLHEHQGDSIKAEFILIKP